MGYYGFLGLESIPSYLVLNFIFKLKKTESKREHFFGY